MPSDSMDCLLVVFAKASVNISRAQGYGYGYEQALNVKKYTLVCNLSHMNDASNYVCCYFPMLSVLECLTSFEKA